MSVETLTSTIAEGANGLMQIVPETWGESRARYGLASDPFDPHDNILAGAAYIRELHDCYNAPRFLAAYNADPGRYENYLTTGRPLADVIVARSFAWTRSPYSLCAMRPSIDHRPTCEQTARHASNTIVDLSTVVPQPGNLFVRRASEGRSQ